MLLFLTSLSSLMNLLRLLLFWCLLTISGLLFKAQAQPVVVVTGVRQVIKLVPAWRSVLNEESFPDYFGQDSLLHKQILVQTGQLLQKKWEGAQVKFIREGRIDFTRSGQALLPPPAVRANREEGDIFVAIVQGINPTTTATDAAGMPVTYFTNVLSLRAEDKTGKVVWESRVTAPFGTAYKPGSTYNAAEISREDWEKLYVTSLTAALEVTSRRLPMATFYHPPFSHPQYDGFLKDSRLLTVRESVGDVLLRKGEARKTRFTFGEGRNAASYELDQQFVGNPEMPMGLSLTRAILLNRSTGQEYELIAEFFLPADQPVAVTDHRQQPVSVRCTAGGLLAGKFTLTPAVFEGQWGYEVYTIRKASPRNTFEIRNNDKLLAVAQKGGMSGASATRTRDTLFLLDKKLEDGDAAELQIVWLAFQMAQQFGQDFLDY